MKDFIVQNSGLILSICCVLLEVLLLLTKNRPKTLDEFLDAVHQIVSEKVPEFIKKVECPGNGIEKKIYVLEMCNEYTQKILKRKLTDKELKVCESYFSKSIELILSTPQKKG